MSIWSCRFSAFYFSYFLLSSAWRPSSSISLGISPTTTYYPTPSLPDISIVPQTRLTLFPPEFFALSPLPCASVRSCVCLCLSHKTENAYFPADFPTRLSGVWGRECFLFTLVAQILAQNRHFWTHRWLNMRSDHLWQRGVRSNWKWEQTWVKGLHSRFKNLLPVPVLLSA